VEQAEPARERGVEGGIGPEPHREARTRAVQVVQASATEG
jgi:hypothetical protein